MFPPIYQGRGSGASGAGIAVSPTITKNRKGVHMRATTFEEVKHEYHSYKFRKKLEESKPKEACENCGVTERLEYHHIVPIYLGGTNNLGNIAVLCDECHEKAHGAKKIRAMSSRRGQRKIIDNSDVIFESYRNGEIGTRECKAKIKYSPGSKLSDCWSYKHYLKSHGIRRINNRVDFNKARGFSGARSIIYYEDGRTEKVF